MAGSATLHFRLFGFPIRVTPFFWVMSVLLGWPGSDTFDAGFFVQLATWVGVVKVSILWHELGHALAMRRYGYAPTITLHWMGGFTQWGEANRLPSPMERVWVSLAGPFAGFLLGLPFLVLWLSVETGVEALERVFLLMTLVNLGYGALNLIPMLPWDGGMAVHGLLDRITNGRGRLPIAILTIVMAVVSGAAAYQFFDQPIWPLLLCWFSLSAGLRQYRAHSAAKNLGPEQWLQHARQTLRWPPGRMLSAVLGGRPEPRLGELARTLEERALPRADSPQQRAEIAEMLAWARLLAGQPERARWAVDCMGDGFDPSASLAVLLALREGALDTAARELDESELELDDDGLLQRFVDAARGDMDAAWRGLDDRLLGLRLDVLLFSSGHYDAAAELATRLFERHGHPTDAYNAACSYGRAGSPEHGLEWLERAVEAGFDDVAQLEADDDLAAVCALPQAQALIARMRAASST